MQIRLQFLFFRQSGYYLKENNLSDGKRASAKDYTGGMFDMDDCRPEQCCSKRKAAVLVMEFPDREKRNNG